MAKTKCTTHPDPPTDWCAVCCPNMGAETFDQARDRLFGRPRFTEADLRQCERVSARFFGEAVSPALFFDILAALADELGIESASTEAERRAIERKATAFVIAKYVKRG